MILTVHGVLETLLLVRHFLILLQTVVLFISLNAGAQEVTSLQDHIDKVYGTRWRGLVFSCDPYCKFLSIRESDRFVPSIDTVPADLKYLQVISQNDPLYPLLIRTLPILPYIQSKLDSEATAKEQQRRQESRPKYANLPFSWAWWFKAGMVIEEAEFETNSQIQSRLQNVEIGLGSHFEFGLAKGKAVEFYGFWLRPEARLVVSNVDFKSSGDAVGKNVQEVFLDLWMMRQNDQIGFGLSQQIMEMKVAGVDSLSLYSNRESNTFATIQWRFRKRYNLYFDYLLQSKLFDTQNFRSDPILHKRYDIGLGYCSGDVSVFDLSFGVCGNLEYIQSKQTSDINSQYGSEHRSQVDLSSKKIEILLRFGEDIFK